ncbi:MAG: hypothetical protein ABJA34_10180 [Pseudonocardiales bacterium]
MTDGASTIATEAIGSHPSGRSDARPPTRGETHTRKIAATPQQVGRARQPDLQPIFGEPRLVVLQCSATLSDHLSALRKLCEFDLAGDYMCWMMPTHG